MKCVQAEIKAVEDSVGRFAAGFGELSSVRTTAVVVAKSISDAEICERLTWFIKACQCWEV